ncbi:MAG TPA: efflux RND transporter periplasmic adaptor subunit [Candidatus Limnocylindria bacterium]|nr:efflux RND transporter periplasmic adaptor subunit [Candidatus Limnocylindria bacterium]
MSRKSILLKIALPIVVILAGLAGMQIMVHSRAAPKKEVKESRGVLVEVKSVTRENLPVVVMGTGTVGSRQEASITPQVNGRVTYLAPGFVVGGLFRKGDLLFRIEDTDYRLAIDGAKAALAKAEFDLATVEGQAHVARIEWERLHLAETKEPSPLVLYEPQLKNARASVDSAKAGLSQAELDLARTSVYAPFPCLVRSEEIDLGQYVTVGKSVATVAGTGAAEIVVPLPLEEMQWITIPRKGSNGNGSKALVKLAVGDQVLTWKGRVVRSLGEVDPRGRMARVVVGVADPYNLQRGGDSKRQDLEIGMFVDVEIIGKTLSGVFAVPRSALRDGDTVWKMDEEGRLRVTPVTVVRRERDTVILRDGFEEGDMVVLTNISGAAEGMQLRLAEEENPG